MPRSSPLPDAPVPRAWRGLAARPGSVPFEVALVVAAWLGYFGVRALTEGSTTSARAHAHRLLDLERWLGVAWEGRLQRAVLPHDALVDLFNWVYIWGHWPVIAVTAVWLYRRH